MTSKNDDPLGCPDTVLGSCEPVCARCGRDMDWVWAAELDAARAELDALHHVTDDRTRELDATRAEIAALRTVADAVKTALTEGYPLHPDVRKAYGAIVDRRLTEIERNDNPRR